MQARRGWKEVFEVMKGKDLHLRILYPAKLSFRMEGQIKCFPDKVKSKEFIITKPLLYEMLEGLKKKKIKTMNSKMAANSQLSTNEPKKIKERKTTKTKTKQTRSGIESEKWISHGGFSVGRRRGGKKKKEYSAC